MRRLLHTSLKAGLATHPSGVGDRVYQFSSLGQGEGLAAIPPDPPKPFLVLRQMVTTAYRPVRETSRAERVNFQLYCYDHRGSFVLIDDILRAAKDIVQAQEGVRSLSGAFCFQAEWLGLSQDYTDDQYDAIVRYANIQMSANQ